MHYIPDKQDAGFSQLFQSAFSGLKVSIYICVVPFPCASISAIIEITLY